ncbi:MAG: hypothetical protein CME13_19835 [Gemmatimonadetes bacterium]|nr:hypothetical protein [Gemmatimonadota bacterium]
MPISCDTSLLPAADFEFVVVADTHYFADPGRADARAVAEFPSRGVQGERSAAVWRTIADLDPTFIVHMGDLVQEYPGRPDFSRAQTEALAQIDAVGLRSRTHFIAGNHDVGDKPDPTMPTHAVSEQDLTDHEAQFGLSFTEWCHGGLRFVGLNSQILNTKLETAKRQQRWLQEQLTEAGTQDLVVFLHLPLYLRDRSDPHLGHYDTVAEPDRGLLLRWLQQARVRHLFAAHVHFRFYDRMSTATGFAHHWICASSCFTRPGFGYLFAAPPAPEQGRDDTPKLGFYWCRVKEGQLDVQFIPTGDGRSTHRRVLTPTSSGQRHLGQTLVQPLVTGAQVPVAYPSLVRQPVRNDYPYLMLRELGIGAMRVPAQDLDDPAQQKRLQWLRDEGLQIQAVAVGLGAAAQAAAEHAQRLDRLEVQLTDSPIPDARQQAVLEQLDPPLALCAIVPGELIADKQHPRARIGYRVDEVAQLLSIAAGSSDMAIVISAETHRPLTQQLLKAPTRARPLQLRIVLDDLTTAPTYITRGLLQASAWGAMPFIEPLIDLDRTMDGAAGLLDPLCNPGPAYETVRVLAALLERIKPQQFDLDESTQCVRLEGHGGELRVWPDPLGQLTGPGRWYGLSRGSVADGTAPLSTWDGPVALLTL